MFWLIPTWAEPLENVKWLNHKPWTLTQLYRKYVIPDTQLVEEGTVSKDSLVCTCPWPPPDDDAQDKVPPASGYPQKALCGGIPGSFLEPLARSWSHFVGTYCQKLTKSVQN